MIRTQSLTFDEAADFYAGYAIWKTRDYGLNAAHPPLVKMLATIPLLDLSLRMPPLPHHHLEANLCGRDFVFDNGPKYDAQQLIWRGRLVTGVFVILLAVLTFCAAREMFGLLAGLFALALFVFDPNVLAHGMYMTTRCRTVLPLLCNDLCAVPLSEGTDAGGAVRLDGCGGRARARDEALGDRAGPGDRVARNC